MEKEEKNEFREEIQINRFKLETECERHSALYYKYSELYADAKTEKEKLELKLSYTIAKKDLEIRRNPPSDLKVTEAAIKNLVDTDSGVAILKEKILKAKKVMYHLNAATESLEHRRSDLKNLTTLYGSQYFSKPTETTNKTDAASKSIRKNIKQRGVKNG